MQDILICSQLKMLIVNDFLSSSQNNSDGIKLVKCPFKSTRIKRESNFLRHDLAVTLFRCWAAMFVTLSMALIISTSICASATRRCSLQPSSARRSPPLGSPSTTGLTPGGGGTLTDYHTSDLNITANREGCVIHLFLD